MAQDQTTRSRLPARVCTPLGLVATLCVPLVLGAQKKSADIERPKLEAGADTNDAHAYFLYGMNERTPWKKAYPAFVWARRLDPTQPYYVFAQYRAAWGRQTPEWRSEYFEGAEYVVKSKEAAEIDTLLYESLIRSPFSHFVGCVVYPDLDSKDPFFLGVFHFENQCWRQAADNLALALEKRPKNLVLREYRARALFFLGEYGNAVKELQTLIATLAERDKKRFDRFYQSKEMYEYMIGVTYLEDDKLPEAKEALGRALAENLAFYMAHEKLARVALVEGDATTAISEMDLAVQLRPDDPALRHYYGYALLQATPRRNADAEVQFRKAIELDPWFSLAYFNLAAALDNQGKKKEALEQYEAFLARAPRRSTQIEMAKSRAAALRQET
jgi:tetratricopeptide (TPR) repeat protein